MCIRDRIHILEGSRYDGYFEKFAERLSAVLTDETRYAILKLKYDTPESEKIMGIEDYKAVIRDGIRLSLIHISLGISVFLNSSYCCFASLTLFLIWSK